MKLAVKMIEINRVPISFYNILKFTLNICCMEPTREKDAKGERNITTTDVVIGKKHYIFQLRNAFPIYSFTLI